MKVCSKHLVRRKTDKEKIYLFASPIDLHINPFLFVFVGNQRWRCMTGVGRREGSADWVGHWLIGCKHGDVKNILVFDLALLVSGVRQHVLRRVSPSCRPHSPARPTTPRVYTIVILQPFPLVAALPQPMCIDLIWKTYNQAYLVAQFTYYLLICHHSHPSFSFAMFTFSLVNNCNRFSLPPFSSNRQVGSGLL